MSSTLILTVGIIVFGLMLVGVVLTVLEFKQMPKKQAPEFDSVAAQAQPDSTRLKKSG